MRCYRPAVLLHVGAATPEGGRDNQVELQQVAMKGLAPGTLLGGLSSSDSRRADRAKNIIPSNRQIIGVRRSEPQGA